MNWIEREFYDEVRYRKSLANAARHVKNGSRTKYVSLPSDGMSLGEWKRRNGALQQYNMREPMKWNDFKSMPHDLQSTYLIGLQERYGCSLNAMAEMFDISPSALVTYLNKHDVTVKRLGRMSKQEMMNFYAFCNGSYRADEPEPVMEETAPEPMEETEAHETIPVAREIPLEVTRVSGSVTLVGNSSAVLEMAYRAVGNGQIKATITWEYV